MLIQRAQAQRSVTLGALCGLLLLLISGLRAARPAPAAWASGAAQVVTWRGGSGDLRWSNPANWEGGRMPTATDTVRLPPGAGDALVDPAFAGRVAAITLDEGYAGTLTLAHALEVRGALIVDSGTVAGGTDVLSAEALRIERGAIVRMGANGKLNLIGDGAPLTGDGLLDTTTNAPNSVEYTGHATGDLTAAGPAAAFHALAQAPPGHGVAQTQPGRVEHLGTNSPHAAATFTETSSLTLTRGDEGLTSAVIDTVNGFAYFGTYHGSPGVVKVRLSDFTRVGALTLDVGEISLSSAVIDTVNGFAYFGTYNYSGPGVVFKVRLSDFTRAGALSLDASENELTSAVLDSANGFAYFGTYNSVVKVRLSDFTRVTALTLNPGESAGIAAVIDTTNGFAYFSNGPHSNTVLIVKVRLKDFTRVSALALNDWEDGIYSALMDSANGFAYFGTSCNYIACVNSGIVVKVRLSDFTRVGTLTLNLGEDINYAAAIDTNNGFAYFGAGGSVVRLRLSDFTRVGELSLNYGSLTSAVIDAANGFVYFGTDTAPVIVVKVRTSDFTHTGALKLTLGENALTSSVIDSANGFAYFGTDTYPGIIVKVRLSDFTLVGALTLNPEETNIRSALIDSANGFAYFGAGGIPGSVVKVRLSDFTRVDALTLNTGEYGLESAVIDSANGFAYFGMSGGVVKLRLSDFARIGALTWYPRSSSSAVIDNADGFAYFFGGSPLSPITVVKVRLSDFTNVDALTLTSGEDVVSAAVIDVASGFAYFGSRSYCYKGCPPGQIMKIRLSDFTQVGALTLDAVDGSPSSGVIDTVNGFAYFGTSTNLVVKVRLSDFTRAETLTLSPRENRLTSAVFDSTSGFAYFGTNTYPGIIVKINVGFANLVLSKSASAAAANVGDILTYTLGIVNDSPNTATSVTLTDTLPLSVTYLSDTAGCGHTGSQVICNLGDMLAGDSTQVAIQVTVTGTGTGLITNTASVSASEPRFATPVSVFLNTLINPLRIFMPVIGR